MVTKNDFISIYTAYLSSEFLNKNTELNILFETELEQRRMKQISME